MRILIVEDEYLVAMGLRDVLWQAGHQAEIATSVTAALDFLDGDAYDAAPLDCKLREESAEPVALVLQQRGIPYTVVSAYHSAQCDGLLRQAPRLGKPCRAADLLAAAERMRQASHNVKDADPNPDR